MEGNNKNNNNNTNNNKDIFIYIFIEIYIFFLMSDRVPVMLQLVPLLRCVTLGALWWRIGEPDERGFFEGFFERCFLDYFLFQIFE